MDAYETYTNAEYDYSRVNDPARIAVYDDLLSSPQIIDIAPDTTREFINNLATTVYNSAKSAGGAIPYSIILQVSENFIHSQFREVVVSVLDGGNTIRFTDQGPGIADKEGAQLPGHSSATAAMKKYINGVGSGLPIVREYMETKNGIIQIEDNMNAGAIVTISLAKEKSSALPQQQSQQLSQQLPNPGVSARGFSTSPHMQSNVEMISSTLTPRQFEIMKQFSYEDVWGLKDLSLSTGIPNSSTHSELKKLEEAGIMTRLGKKYVLTELGVRVAQNLA